MKCKLTSCLSVYLCLSGGLIPRGAHVHRFAGALKALHTTGLTAHTAILVRISFKSFVLCMKRWTSVANANACLH